jgi:uncharacterized protein (TIGR03435 family)
MTTQPVHSCWIFRFRIRAAILRRALAALALALAAGCPHIGAGQTKSPPTQKAIAPAFDVAAIHQHIPQPHEHNSIWSSDTDSHFRAANVSLLGLVHWGFEIPETRILNAPGWAGSTYFNIEASSDPSVDEKLKHLSSDAGRQQKETLVRAMLADRFKLATHFETRELPIYELIVAKSKPKLEETKSDGTTVNHGRAHIDVEGGNNSLTVLAEELAKEVGRPVVDKTGIPGRYNLKVRWTPDNVLAAGTAPPDAPPSIFTALEEQLGLRLKSAKGPVQVLVIDHAEMPSEN